MTVTAQHFTVRAQLNRAGAIRVAGGAPTPHKPTGGPRLELDRTAVAWAAKRIRGKLTPKEQRQDFELAGRPESWGGER